MAPISDLMMGSILELFHWDGILMGWLLFHLEFLVLGMGNYDSENLHVMENKGLEIVLILFT